MAYYTLIEDCTSKGWIDCTRYTSIKDAVNYAREYSVERDEIHIIDINDNEIEYKYKIILDSKKWENASLQELIKDFNDYFRFYAFYDWDKLEYDYTAVNYILNNVKIYDVLHEVSRLNYNKFKEKFYME